MKTPITCISVLLLLVLGFVCADLQNETYTSIFQPYNNPKLSAVLTPLFSPDHSYKEETELVLSAKSSIDIAIPGFSSWSGCTYSDNSCGGCTASDLYHQETFPIFQALVNQLNKGITVRLLTNEPFMKLCANDMDNLTYLKIKGADVRLFTTVSFLHSKYIAVDGCKAAISSINFSKTSFMKNREAGILVDECDNSVSKYGIVSQFTQKVFEYDFMKGRKLDVASYSSSDIQFVKDSKYNTIDMPEPYHFKDCDAYSGDISPLKGVYNVTIFASPDYAYGQLMTALKNVKKSIKLSIYEISHPDICDLLMNLAKRGVDLKLFASHYVYGKQESIEAFQCYKKLYEEGIPVTLSHKSCLTFSHEKYWILDDNILMLSTGNWRGSDYPNPPYVFPAKPDPAWRNVNRDFTIRIDGTNPLLSKFLEVFYKDYNQGFVYQPPSNK
ncbi:hypothetical protein ABK040_005464 [Willaertia magna]